VVQIFETKSLRKYIQLQETKMKINEKDCFNFFCFTFFFRVAKWNHLTTSKLVTLNKQINLLIVSFIFFLIFISKQFIFVS